MKILKALLLLILIPGMASATSPAAQDNTVRQDNIKGQTQTKGQAQTRWDQAMWDQKMWQSWPTVGKATLSWFLFDIYHSELTSPDGRYLEGADITPHPMALSIVYLRDITRQQLLEATAEQWQHLGYSPESQQPWLTQLQAIYPDIKEGERLVYITDGTTGEFRFYGNNKPGQLLGEVKNARLNDAFLAIWLSPQTEYPKLRAKLIGRRK